MLRLFLCGGNFKNIVVKAISSNCMIVNYGGNLKCRLNLSLSLMKISLLWVSKEGKDLVPYLRIDKLFLYNLIKLPCYYKWGSQLSTAAVLIITYSQTPLIRTLREA